MNKILYFILIICLYNCSNGITEEASNDCGFERKFNNYIQDTILKCSDLYRLSRPTTFYSDFEYYGNTQLLSLDFYPADLNFENRYLKEYKVFLDETPIVYEDSTINLFSSPPLEQIQPDHFCSLQPNSAFIFFEKPIVLNTGVETGFYIVGNNCVSYYVHTCYSFEHNEFTYLNIIPVDVESDEKLNSIMIRNDTNDCFKCDMSNLPEVEMELF